MKHPSMQLTLRACAALLAYPSAELQAHVGDIRAALAGEGALPRRAQAGLQGLLDRLQTADLLDLQAGYSDLFDRSRSLSLHLFEHVHGDNRERGQAMIDLGEQYVASGFYLQGNELPDFLPVFLEYVSCLEPAESRETLAQPAHVYAAIADRLDKRQSPYAGIFHALVALADGKYDAEALRELQAREPDDDPARVDDEWEEAPVTFNVAATGGIGAAAGVAVPIKVVRRTSSKEPRP
ncbi:nitrate reductase molybdenum cofactor assembly chaperone [Bordetella genomosp. 7]|nr:nitrate reductase molybdenum cofactor assembly chaperone [Bordetella genomosp. 7]